MKTITKISPAKFRLVTPNVPNSELELDFNPIINEFNLLGSFALLHWQAKPKGKRTWGVYSSETDNYYSCSHVNMNFGKVSTLQIDEDKHKTVPTAVLHYPDGKVCTFGDRLILGEVLVSNFQ